MISTARSLCSRLARPATRYQTLTARSCGSMPTLDGESGGRQAYAIPYGRHATQWAAWEALMKAEAGSQ